MGVCQWIIIILWVLHFLIHLAKDGEEMHIDYSASRAGFAVLIKFILLYFGGFFS